MVHHRGGAQAYNDLLGGRVDMGFGNIPEALRLSREGQVRPLAVTGAARSPQAPGVPAMAGFLPGYEINSWGGVLGPAGIQPALVERIADVGRKAAESAALRRRFEGAGATVWWTPPAALAGFRRENETRFAPLVRASGARLE